MLLSLSQGTSFPLTGWQNFYEIVGSAAGALTGLQFVVLTLVAQARTASTITEIRAFGTPTVVHFCTALLISALMSAPWPSRTDLGLCLGICGVAGVIYSLGIVWHARKAVYKPDLEDWVWYTALPLVAHLALAVAAFLLFWNISWSAYIVAGDALGFLFVGIHNSWDTVTYVALNHTRERDDSGTKDQKPPTL